MPCNIHLISLVHIHHIISQSMSLFLFSVSLLHLCPSPLFHYHSLWLNNYPVCTDVPVPVHPPVPVLIPHSLVTTRSVPTSLSLSVPLSIPCPCSHCLCPSNYPVRTHFPVPVRPPVHTLSLFSLSMPQ